MKSGRAWQRPPIPSFFRCRPMALTLSLAAHVLALSAILAQSGAWSGKAPSGSRAIPVLAVYLKPNDVPLAPAPAASGPPPAVAGEPAGQPAPEMQEDAEPPAFPLPQQDAPRYYRLSELAVRPQVVQDIPADLGSSFSGIPAQSAVLRLFINEEGGIDRVAVEESYLPPDQMEVLVNAFSSTKFRPGMRDNVAVKSQMKIEVRLESSLAPQ